MWCAGAVLSWSLWSCPLHWSRLCLLNTNYSRSGATLLQLEFVNYWWSGVGFMPSAACWACWQLGKVIEATSGLSYCDCMRQHIFSPLGISQEGLSCLIIDPAGHARGYQKKYSKGLRLQNASSRNCTNHLQNWHLRLRCNLHPLKVFSFSVIDNPLKNSFKWLTKSYILSYNQVRINHSVSSLYSGYKLCWGSSRSACSRVTSTKCTAFTLSDT